MILVGYGNQTPVGTQAGITAASMRAGFSGFSLSDVFEDNDWEAVRIAYAEYLRENLGILSQLVHLASPALIESLSPLIKLDNPEVEIPLIIALPRSRPGLPVDLSRQFLGRLLKTLGEVKARLPIEIIEGGNEGFIEGLKKAREILKSGEFCLVGGVDSFIDKETIHWLENDQKRLRSSSQKNGFIPGHAAGFCLLTKESVILEKGLRPIATLLAETTLMEESPFSSGNPSTGVGLTRAVAEVLKTVPEERVIDQIYANLNGEPYNARDLAYAVMSAGPRIGNVGDLIAPHDSWGEIGVAAGPVLVSLAAESAKRGYARGPLNLITLTSLESARSAILLELTQ